MLTPPLYSMEIDIFVILFSPVSPIKLLKKRVGESPHGVMANILNFDTRERKFKLQ